MITRTLVVGLVLFTPLIASALPRSDVLECGLLDGSKFIMTAKYNWQPLSTVLPVSERLDQYPFTVVFLPRRTSQKITLPATVPYSSLNTVEKANSICSAFRLDDGIIYAGNAYFLRRNSKKFDGTPLESKLGLSPTLVEQPPDVRKTLQSINAFPTTSALKVRKSYYVFETALEDPAMKITAVYQSQSVDKGVTWSDPIVTTAAEIFHINKKLTEHTFFARATRINGKSVPLK